VTKGEVASLRDAIGPRSEIVGWATVDLERAGNELAAGRSIVVESRPRDPHLGASCRLFDLGDAGRLLLLEPDTEGRLAASLARFGEAAAVTYLVADPGAAARARTAGFVLSAEAEGPFGPQRLVVGGPAWGPHLVVVLAPTPAATIHP
jgi:hypothetical protein